jgi:P-type Cu2+ transporter
MLRPEVAALSMSGSSVLVAVNAVMLKRLRLPETGPSAPAAPPAEPPGARAPAEPSAA